MERIYMLSFQERQITYVYGVTKVQWHRINGAKMATGKLDSVQSVVEEKLLIHEVHLCTIGF